MRATGTRWTLIGAACGGDAAAQERLVVKYRPAIVSWLEGRGARGDAEDLAQEVFLRLFEPGGVLERVDPERGRFRDLLRSVARNVYASHVRARTADKRGGGAVLSLGDRDVSDGDDDGEFDRRWLLNLLDLALARLRREHPNYHAAVEKFLLEGHAQREVAAALGRSAKDVRNHVHRGKQKLLAYLREEAWDYARDDAEYQAELRELARLLGG